MRPPPLPLSLPPSLPQQLRSRSPPPLPPPVVQQRPNDKEARPVGKLSQPGHQPGMPSLPPSFPPSLFPCPPFLIPLFAFSLQFLSYLCIASSYPFSLASSLPSSFPPISSPSLSFVKVYAAEGEIYTKEKRELLYQHLDHKFARMAPFPPGRLRGKGDEGEGGRRRVENGQRTPSRGRALGGGDPIRSSHHLFSSGSPSTSPAREVSPPALPSSLLSSLSPDLRCPRLGLGAELSLVRRAGRGNLGRRAQAPEPIRTCLPPFLPPSLLPSLPPRFRSIFIPFASSSSDDRWRRSSGKFRRKALSLPVRPSLPPCLPSSLLILPQLTPPSLPPSLPPSSCLFFQEEGVRRTAPIITPAPPTRVTTVRAAAA